MSEESINLYDLGYHLSDSKSFGNDLESKRADVDTLEATVLAGCGGRGVLSGAITMVQLLVNEWRANDAIAQRIYDILIKDRSLDPFGGDFDESVLDEAEIPLGQPGHSYRGFDDAEMDLLAESLREDIESAGGDASDLDGKDVTHALGFLGDAWQEAIETIEALGGIDRLTPDEQVLLAFANNLVTNVWLESNEEDVLLSSTELALAAEAAANWELLGLEAPHFSVYGIVELDRENPLEKLTLRHLEWIAENSDNPEMRDLAARLIANPHLLEVADTAGNNPLSPGAEGDDKFSFQDFSFASSPIYSLLSVLTAEIDGAEGTPNGRLTEADYEHILATADLPPQIRDVVEVILENKLYDEDPSTWHTIGTIAGWAGVALFVVSFTIATAGTGTPAAAAAMGFLTKAAIVASGVEFVSGVATGDEWMAMGGALGLVGPLTGPGRNLIMSTLDLTDEGAELVTRLGSAGADLASGPNLSPRHVIGQLDSAGFNGQGIVDELIAGGHVVDGLVDVSQLKHLAADQRWVHDALVSSGYVSDEAIERIVPRFTATGAADQVGSVVGVGGPTITVAGEAGDRLADDPDAPVSDSSPTEVASDDVLTTENVDNLPEQPAPIEATYPNQEIYEPEPVAGAFPVAPTPEAATPEPPVSEAQVPTGPEFDNLSPIVEPEFQPVATPREPVTPDAGVAAEPTFTPTPEPAPQAG